MRSSIIAFLMLSVSIPAAAQQLSLEEAFGAREGFEEVSLSPDGQRVSYITPTKGQGNRLYTVDLAGDGVPKAALSASGTPGRIAGCDWVSNMRLVCTVWGVIDDAREPMTVSKLIAVNADGTDQKLLSNRQGANAERIALSGGRLIDLLPGEGNAVLLGREYVPESAIGTLMSKDDDGYGVDRVDTVTLSSKKIVPANRFAAEFISDGLGSVRIMGQYKLKDGYDTGVRKYQYRLTEKDSWTPLSEFDSTLGSGFNPYAVDPTENVAYGFEKTDGRYALYKVKLDGSLVKTKVFSRDDVDVDDLITLGRQRRVIGVTFATDKRQAHYFDEEIGKLQASLRKVIPDSDLLYFSGMSADEKQLVIWAGNDKNPGQYYHFDTVTRSLGPLFPSRPELEGRALSAVKFVEATASDGTKIPAYLTLPTNVEAKGLPTIVMPHGGPSARDEWGFDWLAQYFAAKGYAVLQPNYRGSSGYGDSWYQDNGFKSWKVAIGDVNASGRWLVEQGIADPKKLAIVGWSYGGYAALQSAVLDPELFKAIIAIAPVTDLAKLKEEWQGWMNYRVQKEFIGTGPHIVEGSPARNANLISAPVLLFHGDLDRNVGIEQSQLMANELRKADKAVELVEFKGLDHGLSDSVARTAMLKKSAAFLENALSAK